MPHPKLQPSTAQCGPPRWTAQLSTVEQMQVLSSPEVLLRRMSAFLAAARPLSAAVAAAPPLQLLDGMAGEGNYTQHLPDGMGRTPALVLWQQGWSVALSEPAPPTFAHLRANFVGGDGQGRHRAGAGAVLQQVGLVLQIACCPRLDRAQQWASTQREGADDDAEDVAEGLEPVFLAPGAVHWTSHYVWFRWFASGDLVVLLLLLAINELV